MFLRIKMVVLYGRMKNVSANLNGGMVECKCFCESKWRYGRMKNVSTNTNGGMVE